MGEHFDRAILMTLLVHTFMKDWGLLGVLTMFLACIGYAGIQQWRDNLDAPNGN